ncbi:hypothetical protein ACFL4W_05195 [Planctomycetota bacterium]
MDRVRIWLFLIIVICSPLTAELILHDPLTEMRTSYALEDFSWVSRTGYSLPAFVSAAPRYTLWVLGERNNSVMLMVRDESQGTGTGYDTVYADLNCNGVLTEAGEQISYSAKFTFTGGETDGPGSFYFEAYRNGDDEWEYPSFYRATFPTGSYDLNNLPGNVTIQWTNSLADAPIYRFGGMPLVFASGQEPGISLGTAAAGSLLTVYTTVELRGDTHANRLLFHHSKLPKDGPIEAWFRELDTNGDPLRHLRMTWNEC